MQDGIRCQELVHHAERFHKVLWHPKCFLHMLEVQLQDDLCACESIKLCRPMPTVMYDQPIS